MDVLTEDMQMISVAEKDAQEQGGMEEDDPLW